MRKKHKGRSAYTKRRPADEITEDDVRAVLETIKDYDGYPKLRDMTKLFPMMEPFKLNVVIGYLEKSGTILIDGDGYIVWTRASGREQSTLGDVAELSPEIKELLGKREE